MNLELHFCNIPFRQGKKLFSKLKYCAFNREVTLWCQRNGIKYDRIHYPLDDETVGVKFHTEEGLVAFKMVWL